MEIKQLEKYYWRAYTCYQALQESIEKEDMPKSTRNELKKKSFELWEELNALNGVIEND